MNGIFYFTKKTHMISRNDGITKLMATVEKILIAAKNLVDSIPKILPVIKGIALLLILVLVIKGMTLEEILEILEVYPYFFLI